MRRKSERLTAVPLVFFCSVVFLCDAEVVFVVDGQNEDIGQTEMPFFEFLFKLFFGPADQLQAVFENFSVGDTEVVDAGFVGSDGEGGVGCRGVCCVGEDGELAVFLKNGVIDLREGRIAFLSQFGEEFFDIHAVFLQFFLNQFTAPDQDGRGSADQTSEKTAFYKKKGDQKFHGEQKDDCGDCVQKGDAVVEDGGSGDFGEHDGDNEFGDLHFADLPFSHETHGDDQDEVKDQGSENDGCHGDSMCGFREIIRKSEK